MAAAVLELPSSNHVVPGSHLLPHITYPETFDVPVPDPDSVASTWISSLNHVIQKGSTSCSLSSLFLRNAYWRDLLCLSWDFHTFHGPGQMSSFIKDRSKSWRIHTFNIDRRSDTTKPAVSSIDFAGSLKGIRFFVSVDTDVGRGRGLARLLPDSQDHGKWKAFTLFTVLKELKGYEELSGERRPTGAQNGSRNWKDKRDAEQDFEGIEPDVLLVGKR